MTISQYIEIGTGAVELWPINTPEEIAEAEEKMRDARVQFAPIFTAPMEPKSLAELIYDGEDPRGRFCNLYMMCPTIVSASEEII